MLRVVSLPCESSNSLTTSNFINFVCHQSLNLVDVENLVVVIHVVTEMGEGHRRSAFVVLSGYQVPEDEARLGLRYVGR